MTRSARLSQDGYISLKEANLRVSELAFTHELLRSQRPTGNPGVDRANALVQDRNSNVRLLQGCQGLATPLLCTEHMKSHLGVPRDASKRIQIQYYEAGHMMYRHPPLHTKMKDGLDSFVSATART